MGLHAAGATKKNAILSIVPGETGFGYLNANPNTKVRGYFHWIPPGLVLCAHFQERLWRIRAENAKTTAKQKDLLFRPPVRMAPRSNIRAKKNPLAFF